MLGSDWGVGQVFWSFLWFTMFFIWIWLLIAVFSDIFRSHDLGGFSKFIWVVFVVVLPYLGVFDERTRGRERQSDRRGAEGVHP